MNAQMYIIYHEPFWCTVVMHSLVCVSGHLHVHLSVKVCWSKDKVVTVHALKACRGSRGTAPLIFNFGSEYRWVINFMIQPLYLWAKIPGTHWIGGLVGPRTGLDVLGKHDTLHKFMKLHWLFFNRTTVAIEWVWYEHAQDGCNFATSGFI